MNGILVNTIQTRKRCAQLLGHASCGLEGPGSTRVRVGDTLACIVLADSQAAFLDIREETVRCVLTSTEALHDQF